MVSIGWRVTQTREWWTHTRFLLRDALPHLLFPEESPRIARSFAKQPTLVTGGGCKFFLIITDVEVLANAREEGTLKTTLFL